MARYCIDTSAWIAAWREHHPIDVFPTFWVWMEHRVALGEVVSPRGVLDELRAGDDELTAWVEARDGLFIDIEEDVGLALQRVMTECPTLIDPRTMKDMADPLVVALAIARDCSVVSHEKPAGRGSARLKIPDACGKLGVPHLRAVEMLRAEGFVV